MRDNVTMRDIAEKLGISIVTVSKALNDKEGVGEELKAKIKQLADELGYRVNAAARSMKDGRSRNIGVIVAERYTGTTQSFYLLFYQNIVKALDERRYSGMLHILSAADEEQLVLPHMYQENKVDGFIVLGQVDKPYVQLINQSAIPAVYLDFYTDQPDMDCVITDNFFGTYEMTNYLIGQGHRDIAFVGNVHATSSIQDRYLGYYKSLLEHRLPLRPEYIISDRDDKGKFIDITLPAELPSAFVCNCDQTAYYLMQALHQSGRKVPDDCSVVGFDNDIYAELTTPKLTTVAVDMPEMARAATKFIVKKVNDRSIRYGRILVKGQIVYRDSVQQNR